MGIPRGKKPYVVSLRVPRIPQDNKGHNLPLGPVMIRRRWPWSALRGAVWRPLLTAAAHRMDYRPTVTVGMRSNYELRGGRS